MKALQVIRRLFRESRHARSALIRLLTAVLILVIASVMNHLVRGEL